MTTINRRLTCRACGGKGLFTEDWEGRTYSNPKACERCGGRNGLYRLQRKGSGIVDVQLAVGNKICDQCKGTGRIEVTYTRTGTNLLGQSTRKLWNEVIECPHCLGVKKELFEIESRPCQTCDGKKTVKKWVKAFFGGEVEKDVICPSCEGKGFDAKPSQIRFAGLLHS